MCALPEGGVNHEALHRYHDDWSLDDLYRAEEVDLVTRSWRRAIQGNIDEAREAGRSDD